MFSRVENVHSVSSLSPDKQTYCLTDACQTIEMTPLAAGHYSKNTHPSHQLCAPQFTVSESLSVSFLSQTPALTSFKLIHDCRI